MTVVCPATPEHGRTVYQGNLFVADQLLSDSSMRHHPLTPMTDSYLPRVMAGQNPYPVKLVNWQRSGADSTAIEANCGTRADGVRHVVLDALDDDDLTTIAHAVRGWPSSRGARDWRARLAESSRQRPRSAPASP